MYNVMVQTGDVSGVDLIVIMISRSFILLTREDTDEDTAGKNVGKIVG